ncbi:hypothetical protein OROHE_008808 [Orobanche hederae]
MPSQGILKICDENGSVWYFSSNLDVRSNVLQKKIVARILVFKIRPSQEILKIRDGTHLEAEEILTYGKSPRNGSVWCFSRNLDVPSNVLHKKIVARILVFKIRPSQEILKIRDGTPLEAEEILTYRKKPRNGSVWYFSSKLYVLSKVLRRKEWHGFWYSKSGHLKKFIKFVMLSLWRPSQEILKICDEPSQGILKICDGTSLEIVARILVFKIRPSQEILKIRDGTPLEAEEILTYRKKPRNGSWHGFWYSKSGHLKKFIKFMPSQEILKICDVMPSQEILKIRDVMYYRRKEHGFWFSKLGHLKKFSKFVMVPLWSNLDVRSNVLQKKIVARILVFKIRPSQEILKIRDGTHLEAEEILTYGKSPRNGSVWCFSRNLDVPSNVLHKKIVARILVFKIRPSQEILKIRDGTPLEAEEILTYRKKPRNGSVWYFSSKLYVLSKVLRRKEWHGFWYSKSGHLKKFIKFVIVARILVFKIWPSQEILKVRNEILKICDGTPLEKKRARILVFKIRPSQEILKIRDDVPSNVLQKKRARILVFKIRPSQEILKIRDDVRSNVLQKKIVARILVFKIRPSQEILKIRDGTHLEAEEILTYGKSPRNGSVWCFSRNLDVPSNVLHKKIVARILVFKIRPSQEILKIRDGTPLEAEEILTYRKKPRNGSVWYFSSKLYVLSKVLRRKEHGFWFSKLGHLKKFSKFVMLDVRSNVLQKKIVARILVFKIRPSQEILKIRDGTHLEAEEILTYGKSPRNGSVWRFSRNLDVPSNVLQKKRVARILVFKIRPSQEILKIRDGTHLEAEEILTYIKKPSKQIGLALF